MIARHRNYLRFVCLAKCEASPKPRGMRRYMTLINFLRKRWAAEPPTWDINTEYHSLWMDILRSGNPAFYDQQPKRPVAARFLRPQ
jgi:hypothetical protein